MKFEEALKLMREGRKVRLTCWEKDENELKPWECPRCKKINAPWRECCDCKELKENSKSLSSLFTPISVWMEIKNSFCSDCKHGNDSSGHCCHYN